MSKTTAAPPNPRPPDNMELSPVPNKTTAQAADWYRDQLHVSVTPRYLRASTDAGDLHCQIVAGRRMYSTEELWRFIVTRPNHTKRKATQ